jgi:hypothetical protein
VCRGLLHDDDKVTEGLTISRRKRQIKLIHVIDMPHVETVLDAMRYAARRYMNLQALLIFSNEAFGCHQHRIHRALRRVDDFGQGYLTPANADYVFAGRSEAPILFDDFVV